MLLLSDLAQQIVDTLMGSTRQNINIMDRQGIIIASGRKMRIGSLHEGAREAVRCGQTIEIHPGDLEHYPGTRPGINMPIIINKYIIGVVGISGPPSRVNAAAKTVKMVTELILERELLREEIHTQEQLHENLATLLLAGPAGANESKLASSANLLGYRLDQPRAVLAADLSPLLAQSFQNFGPGDLTSARTKENLLKQLQNPAWITEQDLPIFRENHLLVLKNFSENASESDQRHWACAFATELAAISSQPLRVGLGSLQTDYRQLYASYEEALFALRQNTGSPLAAITDPSVLSAYLLAKAGVKDSIPLHNLRQKIPAEFSRKYDIKKTILCLLQNNLNIAHTAKALFIHRNTLLFRLEKFRETTGLDPSHCLDHALLCKILFSA